MAQITLEVAGRRYELTVRQGQEEHFRRLGEIVHERARTVAGAMTGVNEARQLLMTALLLADEIGARAPAPAEPAAEPDFSPAIAQTVDALAERIERIVARFERQDSAG
jgi:cell division protein ZapA